MIPNHPGASAIGTDQSASEGRARSTDGALFSPRFSSNFFFFFACCFVDRIAALGNTCTTPLDISKSSRHLPHDIAQNGSDRDAVPRTPQLPIKGGLRWRVRFRVDRLDSHWQVKIAPQLGNGPRRSESSERIIPDHSGELRF